MTRRSVTPEPTTLPSLTAAELEAIEAGTTVTAVLIGGVIVDGHSILNPVFNVYRANGNLYADVVTNEDNMTVFVGDEFGNVNTSEYRSSDDVAGAIANALLSTLAVVVRQGEVAWYTSATVPEVTYKVTL